MKYMTKIKLLASFTLLSVALTVQGQHEMGFSVGIGPSSFKYENSKNDGGIFNVGIEYNYCFAPNWSVGTGLEYAFLRSKGYFGNISEKQLSDVPEGLPEESAFWIENNVSEVKETQHADCLFLPLSLQYQTIGTNKFYVRVGMKLGIPWDARYKSSIQSAFRRGYSDYTGQYYEDMTSHGFIKSSGMLSEGDMKLKISYIGILETGVKWSLSPNINLYTGVYVNYGFNDIRKNKPDVGLVLYNLENESLNIGDSVFQIKNGEKALLNKVYTLSFGLKMRIVVNIPKKTDKTEE